MSTADWRSANVILFDKHVGEIFPKYVFAARAFYFPRGVLYKSLWVNILKTRLQN